MRGKWLLVPGLALLHVLAFSVNSSRADDDDESGKQGFDTRYFKPYGVFLVPDFGSAEIVAATPDGMRLVYANSLNGRVGAVDITDPSDPVLIFEVTVPGEPTSVAVSPDGRFALAAVQTSAFAVGAAPVVTPGRLVAISLDDGSSPGFVQLAPGPDAVVAVDIGGQTVAVVAIENEPIIVNPASGNFAGGDAPGNPNDISDKGLVQVVIINWEEFITSQVIDVRFDDEAYLSSLGLSFPADPQPEYIAIRNRKAAVTLQENNGVAVIDLSDPTNPNLTTLFSLGVAADRPADLLADAVISFTQSYPTDVPATSASKPFAGFRMPDAIAWDRKGEVLFTADEGELSYTGGRGWSAYRADGTFLWDDGGSLEEIAVAHGQYPDARSNSRGIETEGLATAVYGEREIAFVSSERGGFLATYDITNPLVPTFLQLLPTGIRPEGVTPIPQRNLLVTADEGNSGGGSISILRGSSSPSFGTRERPTLVSNGLSNPWGALSGLTADSRYERVLYAVPDNALISSIYRIATMGGKATVKIHRPVTLGGVQQKYDLEGIANDTTIEAPANRGWWLAAEGNARFGASNFVPNLIIQVDAAGAVLQQIPLPETIDSQTAILPPNTTKGKIGSNGFEGVAISSSGLHVLACIQREFQGEVANGGLLHARVARFDLTTDTWSFFLYPLEVTTIAGDFLSLSEIINLGSDRYAVIERDKGFGSNALIKRVYAFGLDGVAPFDGVVAADTDLRGKVLDKELLFDVVEEFSPFEKIEGLALTRSGRLWSILDNDGGTIPNRLIQLGWVASAQ